MKKASYIISIILISILFLNIVTAVNVKGCKDLVAVGNATSGDYNLLLKVRDPSRIGAQVLCIVPEGYEYTYHYPWKNKPMDFVVKHKFIGVATKSDTIPNIVKAGMALSDSGIAYGDADTMSNWKNPTRHAWDDFDWIRYACQKADDEDEAVSLMTKDLVDDMHASGVSENLFVVGPKKAYVIEADAFHYKIQEIDDVLVMSNYPNELWKTQHHKKMPITRSFDTVKEKLVCKGRAVRLNSLCGVKIVDVKEDYIIARQVPFLKFSDKMIRLMGTFVKIKLGERETVGDYSVELLEINNKRAKVTLKYKFKAWDDKMMEHIQSRCGSISVRDMMDWSRLHSNDLDGLRPMCEDTFSYESAMIYKIPEENFELLSSGWFAANHACSSIYVPVHIADTDIYNPYENGDAAELSLELLELYGHGVLESSFKKVENVFLCETEDVEEIAINMINNGSDVSDFLTICDTGMQRQAWLTEQIWIDISTIHDPQNKQRVIEIIEDLWEDSYSVSLETMEYVIESLKILSESGKIIDKITGIALDICKSRIDAAEAIGKNNSLVYDDYNTGKKHIESHEYRSGFNHIQRAFRDTNVLTKGQVISQGSDGEIEKDEKEDLFLLLSSILLVFLLFVIGALLIKKGIVDRRGN